MSIPNNESLGTCRVVWCPPDPETGNPQYPRNSELGWSDFGFSTYRSTLDDGYWPLGMVLEYRSELYVVCGNGQFWKEQRKQGLPLGVTYPPQKLRKLNGKTYTRKVFTIRSDGTHVRHVA